MLLPWITGASVGGDGSTGEFPLHVYWFEDCSSINLRAFMHLLTDLHDDISHCVSLSFNADLISPLITFLCGDQLLSQILFSWFAPFFVLSWSFCECLIFSNYSHFLYGVYCISLWLAKWQPKPPLLLEPVISVSQICESIQRLLCSTGWTMANLNPDRNHRNWAARFDKTLWKCLVEIEGNPSTD